MQKYITLFETTSDYTEAESTLVKPNVSLIEATYKVEYNPIAQPTVIIYKGDGDSATRIITKNINAFGTVYNLDESSIVNMTLDDNKVSFDDFEFVNIGEYGGVCNVYTHVFGDTNEHVLKIWSTTTTMFKFSVRVGGPTFSAAADFTSIKSIRISDTITSISEGCFNGCRGLLNISIPNTVTNIVQSAFSGCSNLMMIDVESSNPNYDSRDNCNAIIIIGSNVLLIGCKNTTIPNSVTSIYNSAFNGCISLTSITIPNSVTFIGNFAFNGCNKLTSITVEATTPPTLGSNAFMNNASGRKIYVPAESVDVYKAASDWSTYASYIEAIPTA